MQTPGSLSQPGSKSVSGGFETERGPALLWLLHTAPEVQSRLESWLSQLPRDPPRVKEFLEGVELAQLDPTHSSALPISEDDQENGGITRMLLYFGYP